MATMVHMCVGITNTRWRCPVSKPHHCPFGILISLPANQSLASIREIKPNFRALKTRVLSLEVFK